MSKARKVSKIFEGELKSDELTLKDGTGAIVTQKDANQTLDAKIKDIESNYVPHDHEEYADKDHDHDDKALAGHDHDDAYAPKVHEHSDLAKRDHEHSQYITTVDSDLADEKIQRDIDEHKSTNHRFLELSGGHMDNGADIIWPPNTGTIVGLNKAVDETSPVRKKEFEEALEGVGKDTGPHDHPEYQLKGDYADEDHDHPHDHDGTYAFEAHRHDAMYAPIHPHPYAADDHEHPHDHDADYIHDHPYAADDHDHDAEYVHEHPYAADDHDHDAEYIHDHPYAADDHDHDGVYEPVHDHPYAADDHDHDAEYVHDHPYAADDHTHEPQDLTHDHDDQYFAKGGESDVDGNPLPLPYPDGYTLGTALDEHEHDTTHDHDDEYASKGELGEVKGDIESLELGLSLLATTLEAGVWLNTASPGVRPGQMWLAFPDLSVQQNQLIISNEDANGKTHGWVNLHEGDYVEMLDRSDTTAKTVENDYGLFMVTGVDKGNGITTIELELHSGQGEASADELFEVRVLNIADSELDMASLDARYMSKSGNQDIGDGRWYLRQQNAEGAWRSYIDIKADGKLGLYHVQNPGDDSHAVPRGYLNTELAKKADTHDHPYAPSNHSHSHNHDAAYAPASHSHNLVMQSGTSSNPTLSKGQMYLNTSLKVVYVGL